MAKRRNRVVSRSEAIGRRGLDIQQRVEALMMVTGNPAIKASLRRKAQKEIDDLLGHTPEPTPRKVKDEPRPIPHPKMMRAIATGDRIRATALGGDEWFIIVSPEWGFVSAEHKGQGVRMSFGLSDTGWGGMTINVRHDRMTTELVERLAALLSDPALTRPAPQEGQVGFDWDAAAEAARAATACKTDDCDNERDRGLDASLFEGWCIACATVNATSVIDDADVDYEDIPITCGICTEPIDVEANGLDCPCVKESA